MTDIRRPCALLVALTVCMLVACSSKDNGSKDNGSKDNGSKDNGSKDNGSKDNGERDADTYPDVRAQQPDGNADGGDAPEIPTSGDALRIWLKAEHYITWASETVIHPSTGPHFGNVRTWFSPELAKSLDEGNAQHPAGATAVKELYGKGTERIGWAVEVKLADDSAGGNNWYWFETSGGSTYADAPGAGLCTGCHGGGADFVLAPWPPQ